MISELTFARDFSSFWRQATPAMDGFVRRLNKGEYERDFPPLTIDTDPSRRAFVNEVAFAGFCIIVDKGKVGERIGVPVALRDVVRRMPIIPPRDANEGSHCGILSGDETEDAAQQIKRIAIRTIGKDNMDTVITRPPFRGCGIVDDCSGDILIGSTLFEIKAGDRPFRSIDFRQVLTYAALDYCASRTISNVGVVNPRVGISIELSLADLCFEVSGRDTADFLEIIIYAMSSGDVSR